MEELKIGDIIKERYELVRFLGSGSFGEVWLAQDLLTDRDVALKIYLSLDPAGVNEFKREYTNTIDLSDKHLLTPDYFDVYNRRPFLVMKYCKNGSSSKLAGNISEEQLWHFIHDVASGLNILHNQTEPIIHQDIKPDNILVDESGRFLITDFGISKRLRATMRRQSKQDLSAGAMPYMAPERFDSSPRITTKSDIWSLGVSIYELATGVLPFSGFGGGMQKNGAEIPSLDGNWSKDLNMIMQSCLAKDSWSRPTAIKIANIAEDKIHGKIVKSGSSTKSYKSRVCTIGGITIVACVIGIIQYQEKSKIDSIITPSYTVSDNTTYYSYKVKTDTNLSSDTTKIDDNLSSTVPSYSNHKKTSPIVQLSEKTIDDKPMQQEKNTGTYNFGYAIYNGPLMNGKPHGYGRLSFTAPHADNRLGYNAESGDCIKGYFTNGILDPGAILYKKDGTQKKLY